MKKSQISNHFILIGSGPLNVAPAIAAIQCSSTIAKILQI